jgi:hypothetical protein
MQKYTAIFSFIGFYLLALPLAYIFMYIIHMDIYGFWLGIIIAEVTTNTMLFVLVWRFDWDACSKAATDRIQLDTSLTSSQDNLSLDTRKDDERTVLYDKARATSDQKEKNFDTTAPQESLLKSIRIKLIVLFLFVCLFVISVISSVQSYGSAMDR